jgi:hypothetical protein
MGLRNSKERKVREGESLGVVEGVTNHTGSNLRVRSKELRRNVEKKF